MIAKKRGNAPIGDSHWTRKTAEGRQKATEQMSGENSPMKRADVRLKVSGENHWSKRDPEKFAAHQKKMSDAALNQHRSRSGNG